MLIKKLLALLVLAFLCSHLFANDALDTFNLAKYYEKAGNIKKAMLLYKQAASLSMKPKKTDNYVKVEKQGSAAIVDFGKNDIQGYANKSTNNTIEQIITSAFDVKPYNMNYLLPITYDFVSHNGRKDIETKFQISFKKILAKNLLGLNDQLFLGYTQTSWWQTSAPSAPFRESNYEPEVFMMIPNGNGQSILKASKIGLLHQSNGQGGLLSRSWNRVYLSGIFQQNGVFVIPRIWYRFPEKKKINITDTSGDDNPDIYDYLGYGDLKIAYPYKKNLFSILIRNNLKFDKNNHGAVQFDWTFPVPWIKDTFGYLQLFSGYGESLIDYNKRNDKIGLGFAITR